MGKATLGQKQNGTTVNAIASTNGAGLTTYTFNDPFDMSVNLTNISGVSVVGSQSDDQFLLGTSSGNIIASSSGNDLFVTSGSAVDLNGNTLRGASGIDIVKLGGSGQDIDLTANSYGTAASGIEAVVANQKATGESVEVTASQLGASALTDGGAGPGKAFVALLGQGGVLNFTQNTKATLQGEINAAGQGFDPNGNPLTAGQTATLASMMTTLGNSEGTFLQLYSGAKTLAAQQKAAGALTAYIFSDGTSSYTIWTNSTLALTDRNGNPLPAYQPAPSTSTQTVFNTIPLYNSTTGATGILTQTTTGTTSLQLKDGQTLAYAAIKVGTVSGTVIRGDNGQNGGDWFGLNLSGGGNTIYGSPGNDIFDLGNATSLQDIIKGGGGFDVVRAIADGADVDLTNSTTGYYQNSIEAVVGSASTTQTVEVDLGKLAVTTDSTGAKTAVFEALLGSTSDTLTLSAAGRWILATTFGPGAHCPPMRPRSRTPASSTPCISAPEKPRPRVT